MPFFFEQETCLDRLPLFPDTTQILNDELSIGGCSLSQLADEYGTPLYLYDLASLDHAVRAYHDLLAQYYTQSWAITYAGKAYLSIAIARWAHSRGLVVDCTGQGEIAVALAAGLPPQAILVHGVNKSQTDLQAATRSAGTLVVDNLSELRRLLAIRRETQLPELWLRFQPGLAVQTHAHTQTGQAGSKFGMSAEEALGAARTCREIGLPLTGLHLHQGSQFSDPEPLIVGIERAIRLASEIGFAPGWHFSPGGGWGVAYHEDELPHPALQDYVRTVCESVTRACAEARMPLPVLHLEPGRTLVARAAVAVYRVGAVKQCSGKTWLLVDGGMADNPRPALYGVRYSALPVLRPTRAPAGPVSIAGPLCESGDVLIAGLPLPEIEEGELIAVPMAGAYQLSMSSNYNGALRPAVLMVADGRAQLMQRRQTIDDLLSRDVN